MIFINMILIIHSVVVKKKKSDRYRTGAARYADSACGSRMSEYFHCATSWFGNLFTTIKCYGAVCSCGENSSTNKQDGRQVVTPPNKEISVQLVDSYTNPVFSAITCTGNTDPLPSLKVCLEPVEILSSPSFHKNTSPLQVKWSEAASKPRAPPSRSGTCADPYKFNPAKVRERIRRESLIAPKNSSSQLPVHDEGFKGVGDCSLSSSAYKPRDPPSKSGAGADPNKLNCENDTSAAVVSRGDENSSPNDDNVEKEAVVQALLYMGCFFLTYICSVTSQLLNSQGKEVPFVLLLLARFFLPLQGFFNIMVYTRPHIVSVRRNNPTYFWFKAFGIVFKAGGDNDSAGQAQRGSNQQPASAANIKRRQSLIERDHNRRMSNINRQSRVSDSLIAAARKAREEDKSKLQEDNWESSEDIEMQALDEELGRC